MLQKKKRIIGAVLGDSDNNYSEDVMTELFNELHNI
jgi:hypothetical protein